MACMERYREKEHVYGKRTNIRDHNDDIVEVLHDASEYMKNHVIDYRDRPEGSTSKLNTYSDGFKVLKLINHKSSFICKI